MWSRFSEKVKIVPSELRNSSVKDVNEHRIARLSLKGVGGGDNKPLRKIPTWRENIRECSKMESLWGCADNGANSSN